MFRYLEDILQMAVSGPGVEPMARLLNVAAHITAANSGAIIARIGDEHHVLAVRGLPLMHAGMRLPVLEGHSLLYDAPLITEDAERLSKLVRQKGGPPWRWLATMPVSLPGLPVKLALVCADDRVGVVHPPAILERLALLGPIVADTLFLLQLLAGEIARNGSAEAMQSAAKTFDRLQFDMSRSADREADLQLDGLQPGSRAREEQAVYMPLAHGNVVCQFLTATLPTSIRLLHRKTISYHAIRRWRASIKPWQMLAVKQLKQVRDPEFIALIAREMADVSTKLVGTGSFMHVASVPCGNSGERCLSQQIAECLAGLLNIPVLDAFVPLAVSGSSHPKQNVRRPRMKLRISTDKPVLLIDDVATSGVHIAEAASALRLTSPMVFPLVWLADA